MKKLIIAGSLVVSGIICYVIGYVWATYNPEPSKVKEREYIMNEIAPVTEEAEVVTETEITYILYPMYGEILIYQSDGSFYDYTGLWLHDLSKEEQIKVLNRQRVFTKEELYNYLESLTS